MMPELSTAVSILDTASLLVVIMVISGLLKDTRVLTSTYLFLSRHIKSRRTLVAVMSLILGVIPVPGRIQFSCSVIDSIQDKTKNNQKMGLIAHLASHHYYLWSPMEKSVIITCGILGITYADFINEMILPALIMICFSLVYIYSFIGDSEITLLDKDLGSDTSGIIASIGLFIAIILACIFPCFTPAIFGLYALALVIKYNTFGDYVDWSLIGWVVLAMLISDHLLGINHNSLLGYLSKSIPGGIVSMLAIIAFLVSFKLGSSAKYAIICGIIVKVLGIRYLPLFYLVEFTGYIMSPAHSCVVLAKNYFKTPSGMFFVPLMALSIILIAYGVLILLF